MNAVKLDERGRLLLAKEIREKYGDKFFIVEALNEIVLIPIPKDPLKTLREEGKKLPKNLSIPEIKRLTREQAVKETIEEQIQAKVITKKKQV